MKIYNGDVVMRSCVAGCKQNGYGGYGRSMVMDAR
jgi:hypothetical protein